MSDNRAFSDHSFDAFLGEEKLMGCWCRQCGRAYLPPKPICTDCYSRDMEWREMPETGTLAAFTCITVVPPAMAQEGFGRDKPYCSGVVELLEGLRVDARIHGVDPGRPETIHVGMPVRADYLHREKDGRRTTVLAFCPA